MNTMSELPPAPPGPCATVRRKWFASLLFRILRPWTAEAAAVDPDTLWLLFRSRTREIPLGDIESVELKAGRYWGRVSIRHVSGNAVASGLPRNDAQRFVKAVEAARTEWWRREIAKHAELLHAVHKYVVQLETRSRYITSSIYRYLKREAPRASNLLPRRWPDTLSDDPEVQKLKEIRSFLGKLDTGDDLRKQANDEFIEIELERSQEFFDHVESHPLTDEQRRAIVTDEDRNLVVAAAGSGKTSVIVAKAGWMVRRGDRCPQKLLLLAFNKNAKCELTKRVRRRLGDEVANSITVRTFHSLGNLIIGKVEGEQRPSLHESASDEWALLDLLQQIIDDLSAEGALSGALLNWFQSQFAPYKSEHEFQNWGQYWEYIRQYDIRSLKGELVKSFEECEIANFLYLHGVRYKYEAPYEHNTPTQERRQYQPDFYLLPENGRPGIYIEHFGIDASGNTAPFVNREDYIKSMEWKCQLHKENGTPLITTFSFERSAGVLIENLKRKLADHGVSLNPIPDAEVFSILREREWLDPFLELVSAFLRHCKGSQRTPEEVDNLSLDGSESDRPRAEVFLKIFKPVFKRYEETLQERGEIDFDDMINRATKHVEKRRYRSSFGYILVDEFQDISTGRARLIKALLDQSRAAGNDLPPTQLFSVGDDWQAIYRFAGSDISIMREFEKHFGDSERIDLETTFRCAEPIATAATKFVLANPDQLRKTVRSTRQAQGPCIHIGFPGLADRPLLDEALEKIADEAKPDEVSKVLLLGRYRRRKPRNLSDLSSRYSHLDIDYKTIHKSKGLEADYVIVLGLCSGRYGFPTGITDDPLLDLVLPAPEKYPNAEERRLFYVAMTRAKRHVFLLAEGDPTSPSIVPPSSFVTELLGGGYDVNIFGQLPVRDRPCPICRGHMIPRRNNTFYGCSNYPYCQHRQPACSICGRMRQDGRTGCPDCDQRFGPCPQCSGWLRHRGVGRNGRHLLGCSNYPQCRYIKEMPPGWSP